MYKCRFCNKEFESRYQLTGHVTHCLKNPKYESNKEQCTNNIKKRSNTNSVKEHITCFCSFCGKEITSTKSGITFHENRCKENPNRKHHTGNKGATIGHTAWNKGLTSETDERVKKAAKTRRERYENGMYDLTGHKWTDEQKHEISVKRKQYLLEHPDEHVWKRNSKFISKPCEYLKKQFQENGIYYEEEFTPFNDFNYAVDIAWPETKIGIEVNGNQHYNNDGTLKDYYLKRHQLFESRGWNLLELHYTKCFNFNIDEFVKEHKLT